MKKKIVTPTKSELEIMQILWERGKCTVREVWEVIGEKKHIGYTTVMKIMQIMNQKGIVSRDESQKKHTYWARIEEKDTQKRFLNDLLDKVFKGSKQNLVHALFNESEKLTREEIQSLKDIIKSMEDGLSNE